jgi:transcriptional regulator with XRE-family HTH domain
MKVGECLKSLRLAAGLLQRELAEKLGISDSMLSLIEAGKRDPSVRLLKRVSSALEVPSGILFAVALAEDEAGTAKSSPAAAFTEELFLAAVQAVEGRRRVRDTRK